jgi:uncharacterized protein YcbX
VRVLELWRYPVKSLPGERLDSAMVTGDGLVARPCRVSVGDALGAPAQKPA